MSAPANRGGRVRRLVWTCVLLLAPWATAQAQSPPQSNQTKPTALSAPDPIASPGGATQLPPITVVTHTARKRVARAPRRTPAAAAPRASPPLPAPAANADAP